MCDDQLVKCHRCEGMTHESEIMPLGSIWLCGICWDDI